MRLRSFACLSAAGRDGCTRDRLVGRLWPELDARHARHALSVQLHQIRRGLCKDVLLTSGELVRLNSDVISADVVEFEAALERCDLERAADLYRGPFLDGFHLTGAGAFERWTEGER